MNKPFSTPLQFLLFWATETPNAIAINLNNSNYTYAEVLHQSKIRADFVTTHGAGKGTMCAIYSDNEEEFFFTLFGLWLVDAICIPMNITQKPDKLKQMENTVQPKIGFFSKEYGVEYERTFPMYLLEKGSIASDEMSSSHPEDLAIVMFTSGTSGVPKAVPMSHKAISLNASDTAARINAEASDRLLINTPPYTTSSIIHVLTMMSRGATTVIDRRFLFGTSIIDQINEHNCSGFGGVPVHFSRLLAALAEKKAPQSLKFLMNSGDHLPVPILETLMDKLPTIQFYCVYGLTEVAGRLCILHPEKVTQKLGSVGVPLDGMTVTIRNSKGEESKPGELGQVFVRGQNLMTGYINNSDANNKSMTEQGFATGDYGYQDDDGYLFLKGRDDDIFKVGGEKVSVKMIEDAIFRLNYFAEFMVVPEYDEHMGNIACLYYVVKPGEFKRKQLISELRKILPHTHIPARFVQIDKIPRTSSGKPIRKSM
jgi:long-chain acyl-CoA synthetase